MKYDTVTRYNRQMNQNVNLITVHKREDTTKSVRTVSNVIDNPRVVTKKALDKRE